MAFVGGFTAPKPADDETRAAFETEEIRAAVSAKLGYDVNSLSVISFKTQVVAGINYRVHANINGEKNIVFQAFRPLPHTGLPIDVKSAEEGDAL